MIENDIIDNTVYLRTVLFVNSNSDIENLASSGGSGSSGGSSFYHITSTDNTTPSDANGFTALRTLAEIRSAVSNVQTQNYSRASTSNIGIVGLKAGGGVLINENGYIYIDPSFVGSGGSSVNLIQEDSTVLPTSYNALASTANAYSAKAMQNILAPLWSYWTLKTDSNGTQYLSTTYPVVSAGDVTAYGTSPGSAASGSTTLASLSDVLISATPTDGQVLTYNTSSSKWVPAASTGGTTSDYAGAAHGLVPEKTTTNTLSTVEGSYFLRADGAWSIPTAGTAGTTYSDFNGSTHGLVPVYSGSSDKGSLVLYANGTWGVPATLATKAASGLINALNGNSAYYYSGAGTWVSIPSISSYTLNSGSSNYSVILYKDGSSVGTWTHPSTSAGQSTQTLYNIKIDAYGHITASSATTNEDLTSRINLFTTSLKGVVPASGTHYNKDAISDNTVASNYWTFLNASGNWVPVTAIVSVGGHSYQFQDSSTIPSFGYVPCVKYDGVIELGNIIDFHSSADSSDYGVRLTASSANLITLTAKSGVANFTVTGDVTAYSSSDFRLKENIQHIKGGLDTLKRLVPVTFNWNKAALKNHTEWKEGETKAGFIAQDVQKVIPDMVHQNGEYLSLDYNHLFAYMVAAIKDLSDRMDNLEWRMDNE